MSCLGYCLLPPQKFQATRLPTSGKQTGHVQGRWKTRVLPLCPLKREAEVPFHNSITDDFIINIDLKQIYCSYSPTQKIQNVFL